MIRLPEFTAFVGEDHREKKWEVKIAAQCLLDTVGLKPDCSGSTPVHEPSNQEFELWEIKRKDALQESSAGLYRIYFPEVQIISKCILSV